MLTVLVIIAVLGILLGAAVLATYDGDVLRDPVPDSYGVGLPSAHLQPEDVTNLRFDMVLRGYRMTEVDDALTRLAAELAARDERITQLEQALVEVVEPAVAEAEQAAEPPVEAFAPLAPPAAAPAVIAGPLTATTWWTEPAPVASAPEEAPAAEPERTSEEAPALEPLASALEETPAAEPERTSEEAPAPEPVASAPEETPAAELERTSEEAPEQAAEPTLAPAAADDFAFPELHPAEPVEQAQDEPQEASRDWWSSLQEPPSGGRTGGV